MDIEVIHFMKDMLIRLSRQILGFIPTRVPVGVTEFNSWAESFKNTYHLATSDDDSIKFALAAAILNLGTTSAYKPKRYFYLLLQAGCAKQVAGQVFYDIKTKQREAEEAAKKAAASAQAS